MGYGVYFNGTTSVGVLDSTINLGTGDSFETNFIARREADNDERALTSSTDGKDRITFSRDGTYNFTIVHDAVRYETSYDCEYLFDGVMRRLKVTRSGSVFTLSVDGVAVVSRTTLSTTFSVNLIAKNSETPFYLEAFMSDFVVGSSTYPTDGVTGTVISDTSGAGNDITVTDPSWGSIGEWEWVGDYVVIDKTYSQDGVNVSELRNTATRRRTICGFAFTWNFLSQVGFESYGPIYAKNGGLETAVTFLPSLTTIDCDEEKFTTIHGTPFFHQTQLWTSYTL